MTAEFIDTEAPRPKEKSDGAEVIFVWRHRGRKVRIQAARAYDSWIQWGATRELLGLNVNNVTRWHNGISHI